VREAGVDRDRELDGVAEPFGERVLEVAAHPALEPLAGELVGHGDDRGGAVEGHRPAGLEPGPLRSLQLVDHGLPGVLEEGQRGVDLRCLGAVLSMLVVPHGFLSLNLSLHNFVHRL
jgi:hypothetical protein